MNGIDLELKPDYQTSLYTLMHEEPAFAMRGDLCCP